MTRENIKNMLVFKEDCIARPSDNDSIQPFEVVCADENVFVIAPIACDKENNAYTTDYEHLEAYSNDKGINTLEDLGFILCDVE